MSKKKTVLIIDDDETVSGLLQDALSSDGFEVSCCDSGRSALELAKEKCFQIIITDYRMHGMDGVEIVKLLRPQCPDSFIIGISAEHKGVDFLEAGADAFFKKPFPLRDLVSILNKDSKR